MASLFLTGAGGRLGSVVAETFKARGDVIVAQSQPCNYMVFAHRYRGDNNFKMEMESNVEWVAELINGAKWAEGDCGIVIVGSVVAQKPELFQSLAYNLSKAALLNMARYYAIKQPVRINTVSPSTFTGFDSPVSAQEVSNVIAFLCSPLASGINGEDIKVVGKFCGDGTTHA